MKLSNRDKKLLLILGIILVVVVPIAFPVRLNFAETKEIVAKIEEKEKIRVKLKELDDNRQSYEDSIVKMKDDEKKIIEDFDEGLNLENIIMFNHNAEVKYPFYISAMAFSDPTSTVLRESVETENGKTDGLEFAQRQTVVKMQTEYSNLKDFMRDIINHDDHMGLVKVELEYDDELGLLEGYYTLNQYAFIGNGRTYEDAGIPKLEKGTDSIVGHFIEDEVVRKFIYGEETETEEQTEE